MKLGVIFGGASFEHEISIISAIALKSVLKQNLTFIFCDGDRIFYEIEPDSMKAIYFAKFDYKNSKKLEISNKGFYKKSIFKKEKIDVDVYINLIHGADGEDGKIASLFEFFEIPYIGPRIDASVMSFSKELTKYLAKICGVKALDFEVIKRDDKIGMKFPFIIKPNRLGSSIGIKVAQNDENLDYILDECFEFDEKLIIEPYIKDVEEFNVAGTKIGDEFVISKIEAVKKDEILDFKQKYLVFSQRDKVNDDSIDTTLKDKLKENFKRIYDFGFDGAIIRCDFFVIDNEVYLNEINPNPGSLANYLFDDFEDMLNKLANSIKVSRKIKPNYETINKIVSNK